MYLNLKPCNLRSNTQGNVFLKSWIILQQQSNQFQNNQCLKLQEHDTFNWDDLQSLNKIPLEDCDIQLAEVHAISIT